VPLWSPGIKQHSTCTEKLWHFGCVDYGHFSPGEIHRTDTRQYFSGLQRQILGAPSVKTTVKNIHAGHAGIAQQPPSARGSRRTNGVVYDDCIAIINTEHTYRFCKITRFWQRVAPQSW